MGTKYDVTYRRDELAEMLRNKNKRTNDICCIAAAMLEHDSYVINDLRNRVTGLRRVNRELKDRLELMQDNGRTDEEAF